jgi:hypothetical protein
VVDTTGNASVVWTGGNAEGGVRAAHRSATSNTWTSPVTLAASGGEADVAVDTNGNVLAAWVNGGKVYVARKSATGSWTTPAAISGSGTAGHPQIAFDGAGNATAIWQSFDGLQYDVKSSRRPVGQAWGTPVTVAGSVEYETTPMLTVDHAGNAIAAWEHSALGSSRIEAAYRLGGNPWSTPKYVSASGESASIADIDIDESGNVALVWNASLEGGWAAKASSLQPDENWSPPVTLSEAGTSTRANNVSVDKAGSVAVSLAKETDTTKVAQVVTKPVGGAWSAPFPLSGDGVSAEATYVKHDSQGNLTGVWYAGPGTDTTIQTRTLDAAGPSTTMTEPGPSRQTSTSFNAAWSATDRWSAIGTKDVRFRQAPWNGGFGEQTGWKSATNENSATVAGVAGTRYCFSARARDEHGNEGGWSSERCTATPVDDRTLTRSSSTAWNRGTSSSYYLGTYTSSKTNGAALVRTGVQARHLALLVTSCQTCGSVKVSFNGTSLGTFALTSSTTTRKKLISVKTFDTMQTGTLKIQVVSPTGRTVYVDGVVARRS